MSMQLLKKYKDILDFESIGVPGLALRQIFCVPDNVYPPNFTLKVILEEPPIRRTIALSQGPKVQVWTPWIYHLFEVYSSYIGHKCIDNNHWTLSDEIGYRIGASGKQLSFQSTPVVIWNFPNLNPSNGMVCYKFPTSNSLKDLTPAQKIIKCINKWWMGSSNADYEIFSEDGPLAEHILKNLYHSGYKPQFGWSHNDEFSSLYISSMTDVDMGQYIKFMSRLSLDEVLYLVSKNDNSISAFPTSNSDIEQKIVVDIKETSTAKLGYNPTKATLKMLEKKFDKTNAEQANEPV